jgi:hypothetical protein
MIHLASIIFRKTILQTLVDGYEKNSRMSNFKVKTPVDMVDATEEPTILPESGELSLFFLNGILSIMDSSGNINPVSQILHAEIPLESEDFSGGVVDIQILDAPFVGTAFITGNVTTQ